MSDTKKGLFITIEGCDGSGKTTVLNYALSKLRDEGYQIYSTREPGGSKISEQIRNIILDKNNTEEDLKTEALLFAASRRQHLVDVVIPRLNNGEVVISDRYLDSSLAYQGYARGVGIDEVYNINMFATDNKLPDLTVYFDIDPIIGLKRISSGRGEKEDRLDKEKLSFHQKVHEGYAIVAKRFSNRFVVVDASKPLQEVEDKVYKILKDKIDSYLQGK